MQFFNDCSAFDDYSLKYTDWQLQTECTTVYKFHILWNFCAALKQQWLPVTYFWVHSTLQFAYFCIAPDKNKMDQKNKKGLLIKPCACMGLLRVLHFSLTVQTCTCLFDITLCTNEYLWDLAMN